MRYPQIWNNILNDEKTIDKSEIRQNFIKIQGLQNSFLNMHQAESRSKVLYTIYGEVNI